MPRFSKDHRPPKKDKSQLSTKRKSFIDNYFANGRNGTKAYMAAYPDSNESSAASSATKLLKIIEKHPYFAQKSQEFQEQCGISVQKLVDELREIMTMGKGAEYLEEALTPTGEPVTLKKHSKNLSASVNAVDKIAKLFGYYPEQKLKIDAETKNEHSGQMDINVNFINEAK